MQLHVQTSPRPKDISSSGRISGCATLKGTCDTCAIFRICWSIVVNGYHVLMALGDLKWTLSCCIWTSGFHDDHVPPLQFPMTKFIGKSMSWRNKSVTWHLDDSTLGLVTWNKSVAHSQQEVAGTKWKMDPGSMLASVWWSNDRIYTNFHDRWRQFDDCLPHFNLAAGQVETVALSKARLDCHRILRQKSHPMLHPVLRVAQKERARFWCQWVQAMHLACRGLHDWPLPNGSSHSLPSLVDFVLKTSRKF